ncbi:SDR family NAD(P)-dependent oxidoreductase [Streptomyces sp. NPDC088350]|uniref:SDR family NAD(P)-dependent oxidoreductase n=1 Tax=Streptomyces sp. NPDC088350 TaxID=3365854 RepID=UPI00380ACAA1
MLPAGSGRGQLPAFKTSRSGTGSPTTGWLSAFMPSVRPATHGIRQAPPRRGQRDGHVITVSSIAGPVGQEFCVAYAAAKFGVEGWMESLRFDVEPFGIRTTIVEPGFFRTELLVDASTTWAELSIGDYAERTATTKAAWQSMNGRQAGDPAKLARALPVVAEQQPSPRFVAGSDAIPTAAAKAKEPLARAEASREPGMDLAPRRRLNHPNRPNTAAPSGENRWRSSRSSPPARPRPTGSPVTSGGTSSTPVRNRPAPA